MCTVFGNCPEIVCNTLNTLYSQSAIEMKCQKFFCEQNGELYSGFQHHFDNLDCI